MKDFIFGMGFMIGLFAWFAHALAFYTASGWLTLIAIVMIGGVLITDRREERRVHDYTSQKHRLH